jgi:hypothetical protein
MIHSGIHFKMEAQIINIKLENKQFNVDVTFSNGERENYLFSSDVSMGEIESFIQEKVRELTLLEEKEKELQEGLLDKVIIWQ